MSKQAASAGQAWHAIVRDTLKRHSGKLVTCVPDNLLKPPRALVIKG